MKFKVTPILIAASLSALFSSCDKDDDTPSYTVPDTYAFDNVENKESVARISMWVGFTGMLGKSNTRELSQDTINFLWNNTNSAFTAEVANNIPYNYTALNTLSFNLAGKTTDATLFKALADSMVKISKFYKATASRGVPGKIGTTRLFNQTGLEFNQAVAKGLMGSLTMSNIITLLNKIPNDDNSTVVAGQGTAMQHDWDLAFGYMGIPKDYDSSVAYASTTVDRPLCLGGYLRERGRYIQAGGRIFEAFRKGRAAINAKDYKTRDAAIATILEYVEKLVAAAAYAYVTNPQTQTKLDEKFHGLSEGYGFILALKYRPANSKLTAANYQTLLDIMNTDFYVLNDDASNTKLKQAQAILTAAYGQLQP
jgi:hypothetical protein